MAAAQGRLRPPLKYLLPAARLRYLRFPISALDRAGGPGPLHQPRIGVAELACGLPSPQEQTRQTAGLPPILQKEFYELS